MRLEVMFLGAFYFP